MGSGDLHQSDAAAFPQERIGEAARGIPVEQHDDDGEAQALRLVDGHGAHRVGRSRHVDGPLPAVTRRLPEELAEAVGAGALERLDRLQELGQGGLLLAGEREDAEGGVRLAHQVVQGQVAGGTEEARESSFHSAGKTRWNALYRGVRRGS